MSHPRCIECLLCHSCFSIALCSAPGETLAVAPLGDGKALPTGTDTEIVTRYGQAVDAFRTAYPWVTEFVAWNEANIALSTALKPSLAARLFKKIARRCDEPATGFEKCTVAAGSFIDSNNLVGSGLRSNGTRYGADHYLREFKKALNGYPVKFYAVHPYKAQAYLSPRVLNTFVKGTSSSSSTDDALRYTEGKYPRIWISEVGPLREVVNELAQQTVYTNHEGRMRSFLNDIQTSQVSTGPRYKRVSRYYAYSWRGSTPACLPNAQNDNTKRLNCWDAGLIELSSPQPRPGYTYYKEFTNP